MPQRSFLISDIRASRSTSDAVLLSEADHGHLQQLMSGYASLEPTLEGEIAALVAATTREAGLYPAGRNTRLVLGRIRMVTGLVMTYGDLARKFGLAPTSVREICRASLITIAKCSLAKLLPDTPHLQELRWLLSEDYMGKLLVDGATLPGYVGSEGKFPTRLAILFCWDVLRWNLPACYRRFFLSNDVTASSPSALRVSPYGRDTGNDAASVHAPHDDAL